MSGPEPRTVAVPFERLVGWISRYGDRHPGTSWDYRADSVAAASPDGSSASFDVPFPPLADVSVEGLVAHLAEPRQLGVVIVRKGGFAVARVVGDVVVASKVGQRHVQSRSKAGGWSQQRFARRRDNQAQAAYDAASGHVHDILLPHVADLDLLVTAGDKAAVDAVFAVRALTPLLGVRQRWIAGVSDPKRAVLDQTVGAARSVDLVVIDTSR
jgi:Actinobacteria/chloroflexi VLRF1 release factor